MTRKIALGVTTAATVFVLITIAGLIVLMRTPVADSITDFQFDGESAFSAAADSAQLRQAGYDQQIADTELLLAKLQDQINGLANRFGMQAGPDAEFPVTGQSPMGSELLTGHDGDRLDPTSQVLADSIAQITSLRASVDNIELLNDPSADDLTSEE